MIANHHKTFQCQLSYFNCQLPVVYLMQDLHFQIMLLDGSFIHVDMIPSHITHVYCYNAKAVVFLADR